MKQRKITFINYIHTYFINYVHIYAYKLYSYTEILLFLDILIGEGGYFYFA